jgi:hypothetical protein
MSRTGFDGRFPDKVACARHLAKPRWPDGFVCPACGVCKGWEVETKPFTWECSGCRRQTSVTAGTVMHRSKLPLRTWFEAVHLLTSHSNGISAEQAQAQLGIGSYKTAWLLLHKRIAEVSRVDPETGPVTRPHMRGRLRGPPRGTTQEKGAEILIGRFGGMPARTGAEWNQRRVRRDCGVGFISFLMRRLPS